ncbi:MAG: trypsin-like peptidase domain-containing protein [Candidatus Fermentibacteraceae bacterium]|nr:trypsin-like peptidase domain-containing protein [Candidatus Fermentibacteraceae bacterium]MBN2608599.1 trypsin-like peptidase domain-containing protein [Candidatus Fermentibacteraceae bacterium]
MCTKVCTAAVILLFSASSPATEVDQAMVKIYATSADPNYYIPWIIEAPYEVFGSGCVIDEELILTNAHVVSNLTYLQVRREGDPRRYTGRVVAISHEADLALLTVDDPGFFDGITPLELGSLPKTMEQVTVYGYPVGGDALSTTQGVISRIETSNYTHSNLSLLSVQLDAAINPGNSGGPAIVNGKVIGVAMQSRTLAENIGYVVPVPVIRHFFDDIEDGSYDGFPSAGLAYQDISNPAVTEMYGIGEEQLGVLITGTSYRSPASDVLVEGDVILELDGYAIAGDGTVQIASGIRTTLDYLITRRQVGEAVPILIVRDGSTMTVEMTLDETFEDLCLVPHKEYDRLPQYFIYGGLVFEPLSLNYLESWGSEWYSNALDYLSMPYRYNNWRTEDRSRIVIITYILPSEVNTGYQVVRNEIAASVNGEPVSGFYHLIQLLENTDGEFVTIRTNLGKMIILDRQEAIAANDEILARYGIPADRQVE